MFIYTKFELPHINDRPTHPRLPRRRPLRAVRRPRPAAVEQLVGAPAVGTEDFRLWSVWLGHRLADAGPAAVEAHLARYAAIAIERNIEPDSAAVLADTSKLGVLRCRAFFKVAMALDLLDGPETTAAADGSTAAA